METSAAKKVFRYLKRKDNVDNAELYKRFPDVSKTTLRNYKSKYKKTLAEDAKKNKVEKKKTTKKNKKQVDPDTLKKKVFNLFKRQPDIPNERLFKKFPDISPHSLRAFKVSFRKSDGMSVKKANKKVAKKLSKTAEKNMELEKWRKKIFTFFNKNPQISNEVIFKKFPSLSRHSVRAFKLSFQKEHPELSVKEKISKKAASVKGKTAQEIKSTLKSAKMAIDQFKENSQQRSNSKNVSSKSIEKRLGNLEKQMTEIVNLLSEKGSSVNLKKSSSPTKGLKELEENLLSFIKEKKLKISDELNHLDDMQKTVTDKITKFVANLKKH